MTWVSESGKLSNCTAPLLPTRQRRRAASDAPPTVIPARPLPRLVTWIRRTSVALFGAGVDPVELEALDDQVPNGHVLNLEEGNADRLRRVPQRIFVG